MILYCFFICNTHQILQYLLKGKTHPILTNDHLAASLENTNSYCLQGIESHQNSGDKSQTEDELSVEEIPGLEPVVSVLEEVLMWPSRVYYCLQIQKILL